jgi:hypothetical protein
MHRKTHARSDFHADLLILYGELNVHAPYTNLHRLVNMAVVGHTYKHMALMMLSHRHNVMYTEAVHVVCCSLKLVTSRYTIEYILQHKTSMLLA